MGKINNIAVLAVALTSLIVGAGCGKDRGSKTSAQENELPASEKIEGIASARIAPEQMLSRPGVPVGDPVLEEPVKVQVLKPVPETAVQDAVPRKSTVANRIIYRYVRPQQMLSKTTLQETNVGISAETDDQARIANESRLSDMVALANVERPLILSDGTWKTKNVSGTMPGEQDSGPGFLYGDEMFFDETALFVDVPVETGDDPEAVQQAIYFVREAEMRLEQGKLDEAESFFAKALLLFPDTTYVNRRLGHIALSRGQYDNAIAYFTASLDSDENLAQSLNELGIACLYAGRNEKALENFTAAINADSTFVEPIYNAGVALRQLNQPSAARDMMNDFLGHEPYDARAYRELGMLCLIESNRTEAIAMLERAIMLDDSWGMPYLDAAAIFAESEDYMRALAMLDQALGHNPPIRVLRLYNTPLFREVRLIPESRPFESRLSNKLRGLL